MADDDVDSCLNSGDVADSRRPMFATVFLLSSLFGIITNFLLLFVIIWHWKRFFRTQSFTFFVLNMIISALILTLINLFVSVPCAINRCPFIGTDAAMIILAAPNTLGHWAYLFSSFALTIYRFEIFMSNGFSEKKAFMKILLTVPWFLALVVTFGTTAFKCLKRYNRYSLGYTFDCSNCDDLFLGFSFLSFDLYTGQAIPLIMIAAYAVIIFSICRSRKAHGESKLRPSLGEAKLALQYLVICCSQYLAVFSFCIIPSIGNGSEWSTLALNSVGPINVAVNPCVLLLFNQKVRRSAIVILQRCFMRAGGNSTMPQLTTVRRMEDTKPVMYGRSTSHF